MINFAHFCVVCINISSNLFYEIKFFQILSLKDKIRIQWIFVPSPPYSKSHQTLINRKPREISQAISYFKMAALSVSQLSMSWLALLSYLDKSGLKNGLALLGKRSNTDFIIFKGKNSCPKAELLLITKLLSSPVALVGLSPLAKSREFGVNSVTSLLCGRFLYE